MKKCENEKTSQKLPAKKKTVRKRCSCVHKANKLLAKQNTVIVQALSFDITKGRLVRALPQILTAKLDTTRRAGPVKVVCSCCPICGKKLPTDKAKEK